MKFYMLVWLRLLTKDAHFIGRVRAFSKIYCTDTISTLRMVRSAA